VRFKRTNTQFFKNPFAAIAIVNSRFYFGIPNPNFMKKRLSRVLNFFAFNLLFFALYLNFVHKDSSPQPAQQKTATASVQGTVLVEHPEQYIKNHVKNEKEISVQNPN